MAGENPATIATLMGHRTIGMTMRCAHLSPADNQSAVERLVAFGKRKTADTRIDIGAFRVKSYRCKLLILHAKVAELADAPDLGSGG
jgi:hypothetical protein